jgi:uncharacterized protein YdhG (YjbR/CyaY superfamily)
MPYATVQEYFNATPPALRTHLEEMRSLIRAAAPQAEEKMSYGVPAFCFQNHRVLYAVFKEHLGLYPSPGNIQKTNNL